MKAGGKLCHKTVVCKYSYESSFSTSLESNWSSTLSLKSLPAGAGLSVEVVGDSEPGFTTVSTDVPLEELFNVKTLQGLVHIDFVSLASKLHRAFGGVWEHCFIGTETLTLCNPIFNKYGDILFEMRPYVPLTQSQIAISRSNPARVTTETTKKKSCKLRLLYSLKLVLKHLQGFVERSAALKTLLLMLEVLSAMYSMMAS